MAFFKGNFLSASEFQRSAKIGQPLVLEAELTLEGSSTKSWAAGSRRFGTLRSSKFGLLLAFLHATSGKTEEQKRQRSVVTAWANQQKQRAGLGNTSHNTRKTSALLLLREKKIILWNKKIMMVYSRN